jgi:hypothetical protein
LGHQLAVKFDLVTSVDGFLAIKWQAVGIFGDGDLGQQRFCLCFGVEYWL